MTLKATDRHPTLQRAHGTAKISVRQRQGQTVLADLYQHANAKLRLPKTYTPALEAVLINTAGGITGGDTLDVRCHAQKGTRLAVTTQACERIYKCHGETPARVQNTVHVESDAHVAWLPQETILFDQANLDRNLTVQLDEKASFTGLETLVFGRELMGENITSLKLSDHWHITRNTEILFADRLRMDSNMAALLARKAVLDGKTVLATLVHIPASKNGDANRLTAQIIRQGVKQTTNLTIGISAFADKIVCRIVASDMRALRAALKPLLGDLDSGLTLPQVWRF